MNAIFLFLQGKTILDDLRLSVSKACLSFREETVHADCCIKIASAEKARDAALERIVLLERNHADALARVVAEATSLRSTLETLRARMVVDAQDHASVEAQLEVFYSSSFSRSERQCCASTLSGAAQPGSLVPPISHTDSPR